MDEALLLSPEEWQGCHVQLFRLRWGPPTDEGRNMECVAAELTAWRLEAGSVQVRSPRASFTARAGNWLFLPTGFRRQDFSADARLVSFAFLAYWPDSQRPVFDLRPGLLLEGSAELDAVVDGVAAREWRTNASAEEYEWHFRGRRRDFGDVLAMDGWFRTWLAAATGVWRRHLPDLETPRDVDPRVEEARVWLAALPIGSAVVDVDEAARVAGLSVGHLNRLFLHHYHQTLHGFHERRRLQFARRGLLAPGARIKNVAHELGFRDLSKFSSWFRRLEQMSPRSYRNRLRTDFDGE
ncbi:AraC family transcriptional regulator [Opitutaceae bacterium TAV4]|uniref:helix-turn-helix domain-containing protein n=1 Tax=Geminisphaera colitermitum TaxID=1148786 RepID=UPI000196529C|nr:AraC family transcriptional regulator [Geminisphaera colitermitum]RRJ97393.1 AraC family transcriptional regulator [Opitutaceae bacterium TAV4]RRK01785.1 AraC family transcriptional regulator [Opitutaceae bacterium TAV3]